MFFLKLNKRLKEKKYLTINFRYNYTSGFL